MENAKKIINSLNKDELLILRDFITERLEEIKLEEKSQKYKNLLYFINKILIPILENTTKLNLDLFNINDIDMILILNSKLKTIDIKIDNFDKEKYKIMIDEEQDDILDPYHNFFLRYNPGCNRVTIIETFKHYENKLKTFFLTDQISNHLDTNFTEIFNKK